ncbi:TSA1-like protein [Brassica rapa]|uniref:Uncharacterized protein n=1 Tax=Brassica napus TaxID=3708 RepID=A0ABQ8D3W8_BRANA|nr:TSA1-like protein [Brassica rapa]XP_048637285.1 TSA1-like protein [Brassica napus]KAH0924043.1 hypothetical protein HID58_024061 [Brassica napus]
MCSVFIDERGRDPQVKERAETDISVPHAPVRAATKGLGEQKASDSTEGKDHDDHLASRKSMLDAIEREFEDISTHSSL